ncbi:CTP synthase [Bifidobacterium sp. DSM 109958]|uniref:CTP synthase n=1 Tax=Bifidobacterium moraviense TaxID=2675323 RepID=A0A7Y0F366_9BIFI|nr:CTP synthase [Bifidobacterium sp. DSM 109958]NMN01091.1 CTP synthase [Bifidobacterium sp. DSM 109958]
MDSHHALNLLFAAAEQAHRCAFPNDEAAVKAIARRVKTGDLVRPHRGLYARAAYWNALDPLERTRHIVRALALRHPDWVFCGPTAAIMLGLDCSYRLASPICIVARPGAHYRNTDRLVHQPIAYPETIATADGVTVTDVLRTLFDCAARHPLRYALGPLDSALRMGLIGREQMLGYPGAVKYTRNRAAVERAFSLADGRSENGGESEARAVLTDLGYPPQDLQTTFPCLDDPRRTHRTDFLWVREDGGRVAGELDGTRKYVDPAMTGGLTIRGVVDEERDRQRCLERQGVRVVRMYHSELDRPWRIGRRLEEAGVPHIGQQALLPANFAG